MVLFYNKKIKFLKFFFSFVGVVIWGERGNDSEIVNLDQDGKMFLES